MAPAVQFYCQLECCFQLPREVSSFTQSAGSFFYCICQHDMYGEVYFITYCVYTELLHVYYIHTKVNCIYIDFYILWTVLL